MSFQKARGLLTRGNNKIAAGFLCLLLLRISGFGATCGPTNEIISNNMRLLAGNGDTIWVASLGSQGWGVNYTLNRGVSWKGQYLTCLESGIATITFGKGLLLAVQNQGNDRTVSSVWTYRHADSSTGSFTIKWNDSVMKNDSIMTNAVSAVYAGNRFYFACRSGGVAFWDPQSDPQHKSIRASLPGDAVFFDPATDFRAQHPRFGAYPSNVFSVDRFQSSTGAKILALTGPKLWFCDTTGTVWDSSVTTAFTDPGVKFIGFGYAFVNNAVRTPLLYAAAYYSQKPGTDTLLSLFRYHFGKGAWTLVLKDAPRAITPASRGYLYTAVNANELAAYRDSTSDTASVPASGLSQKLTDGDFIARLYKPAGLSKPDSIQDLLFVKTSDTAGNFYIAASGGNYSSDGLYSSYGEIPGMSTDSFRLDRHARVIKSGLGETYALPGIISDNTQMAGTNKTTFIYRLSRDAFVTIKIYDFAMHHVKTVVSGEYRLAMPTGRSTNPDRDAWDATTSSGRTVAPGLYYYSITTNTGERSFGKIVVAKGKSE